MPAVRLFHRGMAVLKGKEAERMLMPLVVLSGCILKKPVVLLLATNTATAPAF